MQLTLSVLRCPPAVTPETRTLTGGEFTIGRGPGVDWVLADVSQMVSRRHCTIVFRSGDWQIIDDSVNGTFSNNDDDPIGKGLARPLRNQDRLRIGPYEIEVLLAEEAGARPGQGFGYSDAPRTGSYDDDPFTDPVWPQQGGGYSYRPASAPTDATPFADRGVATSGGAFGNPFTQDDHSSALDDYLRPPNSVTAPVSPGGVIPTDNLLPDGWDRDLLADLHGSVPPHVADKQPPKSDPAPPGPPPQLAPPLVAAPVRSVAAVPTEASALRGDGDLLAAFLAGAGLPDARPADPVATMQRLGETYRALVAGLRAVLIARASIKSEFRIEQTMIQARGNNPLKFSANDDDAMAALLGVGRRTDVAPARAVGDALRDIRLHELASMAAMQSAVRALLQGLGPDTVRGSVEQGGGKSLLPNQNKARAWEAYEALHGRVVKALSDDFDSVFGKAFARAYEDAFDELAARDRP